MRPIKVQTEVRHPLGKCQWCARDAYVSIEGQIKLCVACASEFYEVPPSQFADFVLDCGVGDPFQHLLRDVHVRLQDTAYAKR